MKVVQLDSISQLPKNLQTRLEKHATYEPHIQANLTEDQALSYAKDADIIILAPSALKPIKSSFINQLKTTKHIAIVTMGVDWIDVEACKQKGISISRPIGANTHAVAEHTLGMLLDLAKRITEFDRDVRDKQAYDFRNYTGIELQGKTLGILGLGNVGHELVKLATGFDLEIIAFDRSETSTDSYQVVKLDKILNESDFIVVSLPLDDNTKNLIDSQQIELMKNGVIIVNPAREAIVNKQAIINGIRSGKVAGYGVETDIMKPIEPDDEYLKYPNIIMNPHNAFNTKETQQRTDQLVVENIINFIQGKPSNLIK